LAVRDGKADSAVVRALDDSLAVRRSAAAEALARRRGREHRPALRKLLQDTDPAVRLRVALALVSAGDREAVAALIDGLTDLPLEQTQPVAEETGKAGSADPGPTGDAAPLLPPQRYAARSGWRGPRGCPEVGEGSTW